MLKNEFYTRFFTYLFLGIALLTATFATSAYDRDSRYRGEFYPLLLFAILGMMVLAAASDLLILYLGLECMSLATYVLVGGQKGFIRSSEAGFKYLLLGGFASAFLLFGIALLYGFAGTTSFAGLAAKLGSGDAFLLSLGAGLVLIGFGFKIATCGHRTSTTAPRPTCRGSWRRASRPPRSRPWCDWCGCCSPRWPISGSRCSSCSPSSP
jgi:NADH-quinone oxidoreductase subunit N